MSGPGPTIRRRQLGRELRRLREAAGKTREEAAAFLGVQPPTISKMELGRQPRIRQANVRALCQLYGVGQPEVDTLLRLVREANERGWWVAYSDTVPDWFKDYVGLESDASEIWSYNAELVHGLLQTKDYMRAVCLAWRPDSTPEELEKIIRFRLARQERLSHNHPPKLRFVMSEAAARIVVGGPEVMREQLRHLVDESRRPNISLRIVPFTAGAHAAMISPFMMLRFDETLEMDAVYLENELGAIYLERPGDLQHYTQVFEQVSSKALSEDETRELLATLAEQM